MRYSNLIFPVELFFRSQKIDKMVQRKAAQLIGKAR